jgi:hypothetical protein
MTLIYLDRRSETIHVSRSALSAASENALAGSRMAHNAIEKALDHVWGNNRAGVIHELGRALFEIDGRLEALLNLTNLAESTAECPDDIAQLGHGAAA